MFTDEDLFKGIILYGLNNATYKMALARTLLDAANRQTNILMWDDLAKHYFELYLKRIKSNPMPQQANPTRRTFIEKVVNEYQLQKISYSNAIEKVAREGFDDVVPRFQKIGKNKSIVADHFYEIDFGKRLILKDSLLGFSPSQRQDAFDEIDARWGLLEGAFEIHYSQSQFQLANDIREIYLKNGYARKSLTSNIPFLQGYQGNTCFYCGERILDGIEVDHVLPRQVINHDEVWNLVLTHGDCNLNKLDRVVSPHFIQKLQARNENIMGSNHPWKHKISTDLGNTPAKRKKTLLYHYDNVKQVLGNYYWGGDESYNPETDPFYKRFITVLNKK